MEWQKDHSIVLSYYVEDWQILGVNTKKRPRKKQTDMFVEIIVQISRKLQWNRVLILLQIILILKDIV